MLIAANVLSMIAIGISWFTIGFVTGARIEQQRAVNFQITTNQEKEIERERITSEHGNQHQ